MPAEHDYKRRGALAYLAAWDVRRGQVTGRCEHTTGITPFSRLVRQVMTAEALRQRGPGVLDHRQRVLPPRRRLHPADDPGLPNAHLIHLPAHASWLNQAEIYFSIIQRKVISPNDFTGLGQIRDRLAAFETRYNAIARPFSWTFTRTDLDDLLDRIDAHEQTKHQAPRPGSMNSAPDELTGATT